ncbi:MAG: PepSY-associated TM helix domain-containing protein [Verrucomicrobiota bacterium JB023]|nr:PepSY-associated TM helix domain-containing protein [Verrucomicrobiota bacterium JB023]
MRKKLWQLHSVVGLLAGLGLLLIGLTGSLLIFHEELDQLFFSQQHHAEPVGAGRLPLDELIARVEAAHPDKAVTGWHFAQDGSKEADGVYVMPFGTREWRYLTLDPYRGILLTQPKPHGETLKGWLLSLHESLFLKDIGLAISGLLGVALCLLSLSGIILYRRFWKTLFRLRFRASFRMLSADLHRLVGVFSVIPNLILGITGAYWNLGHTIEHLLETEEEHAAIAAQEPLFYEKLFAPDFSVEALVSKANKEIPGFQTAFISFPWAPEGPFTLWGQKDTASPLRNSTGSWVSFDSQTGDPLSHYDLTEQSAWTQLIDSFEPLHFGTFGGLPVKIFYSLAGLGPGILTLSGTAIWWSRRKKAQLRRP